VAFGAAPRRRDALAAETRKTEVAEAQLAHHRLGFRLDRGGCGAQRLVHAGEDRILELLKSDLGAVEREEKQ